MPIDPIITPCRAEPITLANAGIFSADLGVIERALRAYRADGRPGEIACIDRMIGDIEWYFEELGGP